MKRAISEQTSTSQHQAKRRVATAAGSDTASHPCNSQEMHSIKHESTDPPQTASQCENVPDRSNESKTDISTHNDAEPDNEDIQYNAGLFREARNIMESTECPLPPKDVFKSQGNEVQTSATQEDVLAILQSLSETRCLHTELIVRLDDSHTLYEMLMAATMLMQSTNLYTQFIMAAMSKRTKTSAKRTPPEKDCFEYLDIIKSYKDTISQAFYLLQDDRLRRTHPR